MWGEGREWKCFRALACIPAFIYVLTHSDIYWRLTMCQAWSIYWKNNQNFVVVICRTICCLILFLSSYLSYYQSSRFEFCLLEGWLLTSGCLLCKMIEVLCRKGRTQQAWVLQTLHISKTGLAFVQILKDNL